MLETSKKLKSLSLPTVSTQMGCSVLLRTHSCGALISRGPTHRPGLEERHLCLSHLY